MIIKLTEDDRKAVKEIAAHREFNNRNKHDIASYNPERMRFNSYWENIISLAAEAAVVIACGYELKSIDTQVWPYLYMDFNKDHLTKGRGDVNHNGLHIEVRRVNEKDRPLAIRKKDLGPNNINVKTYIEHSYDKDTGEITWLSDEVHLIGWCWSNEGWEDGSHPRWNGYRDKDAKVIDDYYLNTDWEEIIK